MENTPRWDLVDLQSVGVGAPHRADLIHRHDSYPEGEYQYCTPGEFYMALYLVWVGVKFVPDVRFSMLMPHDKKRWFVPDFVFAREEWLWLPGPGWPIPVHGFEIKAAKRFPHKAHENVKLVQEQYGLNILLIHDEEAKGFWRNRFMGGVPSPPILIRH